MNKYLITYDLKNKGIKNYDPLHTAIKGAGSWWHYLESTWIVKTNLDSGQIWNLVHKHILNSDYLLIIKIDTTDKYGWLPPDAWNWLNN